MDTWIILFENRGTVSPDAGTLALSLSGPGRIVTVGPERKGCLLSRLHVGRPDELGTGPDALLALFHVLARDPDAAVVLIPGDFEADAVSEVGCAVKSALMDSPDAPHLVAAERGVGRPGCAWIIPLQWGENEWPMVRAVDFGAVGQWMPRHMGAMADTGVIVSSAWALLTLIRNARPDWFHALRQSVWAPEAVETAFGDLEPFELLADVLVPALDELRVVPALPWKTVGPTLRQVPVPVPGDTVQLARETSAVGTGHASCAARGGSASCRFDAS